MKIQGLILSAVTACLMVGASGGAAMASCGDGVLENETFEGNLFVTDELSCSIISSSIQGDLTIRDTSNVLLLNNKVGGRIRVIRTDGQEGVGVANVIANTVFSGDLIVKELATANIIENETLTGTIRVSGNTNALAQKNIAKINLICENNTSLAAFLNVAGKTLSCE